MNTTDCCDGYGRMTWSMVNNTRILGRDRAAKRTLLGGLGIFGIGHRWHDDASLTFMRDRPEWDSAPEMTEAEYAAGAWRNL